MSMRSSPRRHVVVVGGGIAGLAAARFLGDVGGDALRVTVLEGSSQVGGKLRVSEVAGLPVDEGAESILVRRAEGLELVDAAGLADDLVHAATASASVWSRGALRPLPAGTVMGIPTDLRALAASGLLTSRELARVPLDAWLPRTSVGDDVSVGRYVSARMGGGVVDRIVEPLLGGVYAGHASLLSLDATLPQLAPHVRLERSLLRAARASREAAPPSSGPVFGSLRGGLGRLPEAVAKASGADIRTGVLVRELRRAPKGWALITGPTRRPERVEADAVILAVPPAAAARLLRGDVPVAAAELAGVSTASMAVITLAFDASRLPALPPGSGFLVPPVERRLIKAATFSTSKWAWYADLDPALVVVRLSVGRFGEEADLQRDDDDLVELATADLAEAIGWSASPVDARVTRWGGGLPQYAVGHRGRVARVRAAVAAQPGLAVCGATYDGVGIPACVATAQRAALEVLGQWRHG